MTVEKTCSACSTAHNNTSVCFGADLFGQAAPLTHQREQTVGKVIAEWYCTSCDAWWKYHEGTSAGKNCQDCGCFMKPATKALKMLEWMKSGWWP